MVACGCQSFASLARTRVTLQQYDLVDDGIGGKTKEWSDLTTVWAVVKAASNWRRIEVFQAQELQGQMQQAVTIRYIDSIADTTVAAKLRILVESRIFNVKGVENLHDDMKTAGRVFQTLYCVEGEAA